MMKFIQANKIPIAGILGAGLLLWGYFMFFSGGSSGPLLSSSSTTAVTPVTQELLITLANLRIIHLDEAIFSDPVFESLSDFGVVIPPEAIGRRNPFAPLGFAESAPATTTSSEEGTEEATESQ